MRAYLPFVLWLCLLLSGCASLRQRSERAEARGEYARAALGYQRLYRQTSTQKAKHLRAHYAYRAAECNLRLRNISKALSQYQAAEAYGAWKPPLNYRIAYCLHALGRYEEAIQYYQWHLNEVDDSLATVGLAACQRFAGDTTASRYQLTPLTHLHSTGGDFSPQFSSGDNALYLVSRRRQGRKAKPLPTHGAYRGQAYRLERQADGSWASRMQPLEGLMPPQAEAQALALSSDGQYLYYIQPREGRSRLFRSHRLSTGGFAVGEELRLGEDFADLQGLSLHRSGTQLYLSARPVGQSDYDLYVQQLSGTELVGKPQRLGADINTTGDELSPYAQGDSTLYLATDGRLSYGGYDLYRADLGADGAWRLSHLPAPLNSPADEFALAPDYRLAAEPSDRADAERGIILSNRADTRGRGQLYAYRLPRAFAQIDGYVLDREGYGISGATIRLVGRYGTVGERLATSRSDGSFDFEITASNQYVMHASCAGYLSQYAELKTTAEDEDATYQVDFTLAQRSVPEVLRELYFGFDSATILPESGAALGELTKILRDNPDIRLQISAHTDRQGSEAYNAALSQRRAAAVVAALVEQGIDRGRLVARGFAWREPYVVSRGMAEQHPFLSEGQVLSPEFIESLADEAERSLCDALNRRSEFLVLP